MCAIQPSRHRPIHESQKLPDGPLKRSEWIPEYIAGSEIQRLLPLYYEGRENPIQQALDPIVPGIRGVGRVVGTVKFESLEPRMNYSRKLDIVARSLVRFRASHRPSRPVRDRTTLVRATTAEVRQRSVGRSVGGAVERGEERQFPQ